MSEAPASQRTNERPVRADIRGGLHLHFDPVTGIAGDMVVAALVDAGVPETVVLDAINAMGVPGLTARFRREKGEVKGLRFQVCYLTGEAPQLRRHHHGHVGPGASPSCGHRHHAEIQRMLKASGLSRHAHSLAERMFQRLAQVEAQMHQQPIESVVFHEVGGMDSIADIVGVAAAIAWLAPISFSASPPLLGSGTVVCSHGTVPVPAPATASLLAGYRTLNGGQGELTTPTGALVLTSLVAEFGAGPPMQVVSRGYGIGTKIVAGRANGIGVVIGEPAPSNASVG